jgi:hypothetical protein
MPSMTDPMVALVSFQKALLDGEIRLLAGELDPDLFVNADNPAPGISRITAAARIRVLECRHAGRLGALATNKKLSKKKRQANARRAAKARWAKAK